MRSQLPVSERRACDVVGQVRSTQRRSFKVRSDEAALTADIVALACAYGRYGYQRIHALLKARGWRVNIKRVYRVWRRPLLRSPPARRAQSTIKATETAPPVAMRWIVRPLEASSPQPYLVLRLRPRPYG